MIRIGLGWPKGLSTEFSSAKGEVTLDLVDGTVWVEVDGGADLLEGGLWIVDNVLGPGRTVRPEAGDRWISLGTLAMGSDAAGRAFDFAQLRDFEVDLVVVTRPGGHPTAGGVLFGSAPLFSRLYSLMRREGSSLDSVAASIPSMVERGEALFFAETFGGNGRTCGTCALPKTT